MTWYTVVTRSRPHQPIQRYASIEAAGNRIFYDRRFDEWTVLAQDGSEAAPYRELHKTEKQRLERCLYPGLFE